MIFTIFFITYCGIISVKEGDTMYSLLIDTHGSRVILILFKSGKVFCNKTLDTNNKHSVVTFPLIKEIFEENNLNVHNLSQVMVVNGPGSFTGVRIAVTIAKTLAYTLNIPIKSIDSLMLLAININDVEKYVAITDRNGAFVGHFAVDNNVMEDYKYYNKSEYETLCKNNKVFEEDTISINYEVVYSYLETKESVNPHLVNPLYVKGLNIRNDK